MVNFAAKVIKIIDIYKQNLTFVQKKHFRDDKSAPYICTYQTKLLPLHRLRDNYGKKTAKRRQKDGKKSRRKPDIIITQ